MHSIMLEKNLDAIKNNQANIYQALIEYIEKAENKRYRIENNGEFDILYYLNDSDKYIQYTSLFDPNYESKEKLDELDFSYNRTTFLLVGIALGQTLTGLLRKLKARDIVVCFEQDCGLLLEVLRRIDFSQYLEERKLFFVIGGVNKPNEDEQVLNIVFSNFENFISKIQPVLLSVYTANYISYASRVIRMTYEKKEHIKFSLGNNLDDTLVGLDNYLLNLNEFLSNPGINEFMEKYRHVYKGRPAIIVASGPSLNKNASVLKDALGKALILCCDGSMETLRKQGIKVDIVGSVERILKTYEAFYKDKIIPEDATLAAPTIVDPNILKEFPNQKLLFMKMGDPYAEWINKFTDYKKGTLFSNPSVSHMLFSLAEALGAEPIILVGQDLAYSKDGFSHVKEAGEVLEKVESEKVNFFVEDYDGNPLPSTYVWQQFLNAYENRLLSYKGTVIDATEGGARIKGTSIMTLRNAVDRYCNENLPSFSSLVRSLYVDNGNTAKYLASACYNTAVQIRKFNILRMMCEKALRWIDKSRSIHKNGISTQEELDYIYDCIDYGGEYIAKFIYSNPMMNNLFQYLITVSIYAINMIKSDRYTIETIGKNLDILYGFITEVRKFTIKTMRLFYRHYRNLEGMITEFEEHPVLKPALIKLMEKYTADPQYEILEKWRRGY